jgi:hypothetical protein
VSPIHLPFFGRLGGGSLAYAVGYSGNGVGPSHLAGRILTALALDLDDPVARLPLVGYQPRRFPPEPVRSIGAHLAREAVVRKERAEDEGRRPNPLVSFTARLPRKLGYHLGPR